MSYRLGMDVGTASCGLVAWALDEQGQPSGLALHSLDIWSEPLLPAKSGGVGEPKKAARRAARMMRRGIYRRARRLRKIAYLSELLGLDRTQIASDTGQRIHALRAKAAEERIELDELLPVLLHLAKHRGPSGDWVYAQPEATDDKKKRSKKKAADAGNASSEQKFQEEKKDIVGGVRRLEQLITDAAQQLGKEPLTLGQYLAYRREKGEGVHLGKPSIGLYPSRQMVEDEFNRIWDTQAAFHPIMKGANIRDEFHKAIFFQRSLKSPAPMVGHCPLEPTLPRAPAAQMIAQEFRIEKQLADLRWGIGKHAQPLSVEQRAVLGELLNDAEQLTQKGELSFKKVLAAFDEHGCPGPKGRGLNMDRSSRESLKGNTTLAAFAKLGMESEWQSLSDLTQDQVINFLADLGSPDALDNDDWDQSFQTRKGELRKFEQPFVDFLNQLRGHPKFGRLSAMGFDGGRMGYSIKALKRLTTLMSEGWDEYEAIKQAYPDHFETKPVTQELPLPKETGNTVVDVALRQVYRAVDRAMKTLGGPPSQVIVELSRDMALGIKKRGEIENRIKHNNKARKDAAKAIVEEGEQATERNIHRYLLWESQSHYCPYCADRITLREALSGETEREHILPRTLTRVGGKRNQIVLAHRACNQEKGNRTPYQAFGSDEARWRIIEERAAQLEKNRQWRKARLLLLKDWEDEVLDDAAISGFSDRQFHEGSWIAKLTAQWLRCVCPDVAVSRGELTAHLRRIWKLDTVIPQVRYESGLPVLDIEGQPISPEDFERHRTWWEGHDERAGGVPTDRKPDKRIDHRHHLVDALVISLTSHSLYMKMANNYKLEREKERRGERARLRLYKGPPVPDIRDFALEIVRNAEIRHKPDRHPDGAFFEQTAYGISRRPDEKSGKYLLVVSKPLSSFIDKGNNVEKTRRALEGIEGDSTREAVLQAFDRRIAFGVNLKQVFDEPILHPQFQTPIKRVRVKGNSVDTAAVITHKNRHGQILQKRYVHESNAYLEIRVEDSKPVGKPRLVPVQEAKREKSFRPPEGVRRFWKGDTVILEDGSLHVIGQIKEESNGRLCLIPVTETCGFDELSKRGLKKRTVSGGSLSKVRIINV